MQDTSEFNWSLDGSEITVGRSSDCTVKLRGIGISRVHAKLLLLKTGPIVEDCSSSFGTRVNNVTVKKEKIKDGDSISFGVITFKVKLDDNTLILNKIEDLSDNELRNVEITDNNDITIGRDTTNTISLSHPLVSRFHCVVVQDSTDNKFYIKDLESVNGTYLNGRSITRELLKKDDIIQIGPFRFIFGDSGLVQAEDSNRIRLDADSINVQRGRERVLKNVSLSIASGEFACILGPSGSGKTSLALALTGQIPLHSGSINYNGFPLNKFRGAFDSSIGYVSQHDMLRPELTVWETMWEQSLLRLPHDSISAERIERINDVMNLLEIQTLGGRRISNLSGGESKRVHLGVELLSSPTILFLDEPLAGLDAGLISRFMQLFKRLSEKGHTLLLTTHTLEQIETSNRIIFLNKGSILYDGSPNEIKDNLGVNNIAELYELARLGKLKSSGSKNYDSKPVDPNNLVLDQNKNFALKHKKNGLLLQLSVLIPRYAKILVRDVRNLMLILAQAPLIAILLGFVFKPTSEFLPVSFYFCITISAIWIGGINSIKELAKEWLLFDREYRVGLSPMAFLLSKITVFGLASLFQALLFSITLRIIFSSFEFSLDMLLLVSVAVVSGSYLGLFVSAFSGNVSRAVSFLPIIFIPQIFFSGILIPFDRMPFWGRIISFLTISRPVFSMFKKHFLLEQNLFNMKEWFSLLLFVAGLIILTGIRIYTRIFGRDSVLYNK